MNPAYPLTIDELSMITRYLGEGDYPNSRVLFFGIEEGTGGKPVGPEIQKRTVTFPEQGLFLNGRDPIDGYYVNPCAPGYAEMRDKIDPSWRESIISSVSPFWSYAKRMILHLEGKSQYAERFDTVLYQPRPDGIGSAIIDWRPLPRYSESGKDWEYEVTLTGSDGSDMMHRDDYLQAFNFHPRARHATALQLRRDRLRLIGRLISQSPVRMIIGVGGIRLKERVFKELASENGYGYDIGPDIHFAGDARVLKKGKVLIGDREVVILLLPFFDNRQMGNARFERLLEFMSNDADVTAAIKS